MDNYYSGYQYQRGHGFFGTLFANLLTPLAKYFGKQAVSTGVRMGHDLLEGERFGDTFRKNIKISGKTVLDDGLERLRKFQQTGTGKRRRRRKKSGIKKKQKKSKSLMRKKVSKQVKKSKSKRRRKSVKKKAAANQLKLFKNIFK